jgi:hypothetical protein
LRRKARPLIVARIENNPSDKEEIASGKKKITTFGTGKITPFLRRGN